MKFEEIKVGCQYKDELDRIIIVLGKCEPLHEVYYYIYRINTSKLSMSSYKNWTERD